MSQIDVSNAQVPSHGAQFCRLGHGCWAARLDRDRGRPEIGLRLRCSPMTAKIMDLNSTLLRCPEPALLRPRVVSSRT